MTKRELPIWAHILLLVTFSVLMIAVWMLPMFAMGYPLQFPELSATKVFLEKRVLPSGDGRISILLFALLSKYIPLENFFGWQVVSAVLFALSLLPFWFSVRKLFDEQVAWISTILLSVMPVYFFEAMHLNFYKLAFLFLFTAFACYLYVPQKHILLRWILFGIFLGFAAGAKEVFIVLFPWILISQWKSVRIGIVFCTAIAVGYCLPLLPQLIAQESSAINIVQQLSPIGRTQLSPYEHYPDPYTYEFDREWHDASINAKRDTQSWVQNMRHQHRHLSFGVIGGGIVASLTSSVWLLGNNLISYVHISQFGGAALWVFILLGGVHLYRQNRKLLWWYVGLVVSMEVIIRFGLHFQRGHHMNIGWGLAVLAALGIMAVVGQYKKVSVTLLVTVLLSVHLLQINRAVLAREYLRSEGPRILMEAELFADLPANAVVAVPRTDASAILGASNLILFHTDTLVRLVEQQKVYEAFTHYGVTHISRYPRNLSRSIKNQYPVSIISVAEDTPPQPPVSDVMTYVLNLLQ